MPPRWRALRRWYQDHQVGVFDLMALAVACVLVCGLIFSTEIAVPVLRYAREHSVWQLESVFLCLATTWGFLAIFAWRRWRDVIHLLEAAETDVLTSLANRRKTLRVLAHEFDRAERYGRPLSLVMLDIDHFKQVNDSFGHPVGDEVLRAVARRIQRKMRVSDHFGRWGGEEFLLICPETDDAGAVRIAERMRRAIKQSRVGRAGQVTASFGVSTYLGEGDCESLIEQADRYLYAAKQGGRDCVMSISAAARSSAPTELLSEMDMPRVKPVRRRI